MDSKYFDFQINVPFFVAVYNGFCVFKIKWMKSNFENNI